MLERPDRKPPEQIHENDNEASDGVALYKLRRPVHRAIKMAFSLETAAQPTRLGLVDITIAQIAVDAHLLTRQRIQTEPSRDLSDALRALRDNHELRHRNDQKHDESDGDVVADHEATKGVYNLTGIGLKQNQSRGRDGDRKAKQRGNENDRGQRGEFNGARYIKRSEQNEDTRRDVGSDQHVNERGG